MTTFNASIESLARMNPSHVLAHIPPLPHIECGCCHTVREQHGAHPILGPLCVWCARSFDYKLTGPDHLPVHAPDACPFCLEIGNPCIEHAGDE